MGNFPAGRRARKGVFRLGQSECQFAADPYVKDAEGLRTHGQTLCQERALARESIRLRSVSCCAAARVPFVTIRNRRGRESPNFDNLPHPLRTSSRMETLNQISDGDPVKIIPDGGPGLGKSPQTPAHQST